MPPSKISPVRRTDSRRSEELNSSLQSLMKSYRDELSKPWNMSPASESKFERRKSKKSHKMDPPGVKGSCDESFRPKKDVKATSSRRDVARTSKSTSRSSRVHPTSAVSAEVSKWSKREQTDTKDGRRIKEATKRMSYDLYEEFPERRFSVNLDRNGLNNSTTSINRDDHGLFVEEMDWKNSSIDWGDESEKEEMLYTQEKYRCSKCRSSMESSPKTELLAEKQLLHHQKQLSRSV